MHPEVIKALGVAAEIAGRAISKEALRVMAQDLENYPTGAVLSAIDRCRKELKFFPTVADILDRIAIQEGGHPGVEEAWAMIPKDEDSSVVWTDEMREAYGVARPLLVEDPIAARMTFKEVYPKLISQARASGTRAHWTASLGFDKEERKRVLLRAVEQKRMSRTEIELILPDLRKPEVVPQIAGPVSPPSSRVPEILSGLLKSIPRPAPETKKEPALEMTWSESEARRETLREQARRLDENEGA